MQPDELSPVTLPMKRLINQRDVLPILLSTPTSILSFRAQLKQKHKKFPSHKTEVSNLSALEFASLLYALSEDMVDAGNLGKMATRFNGDQVDTLGEHLRKRQRPGNSNNNYSILSYIGRVISREFGSFRRRSDECYVEYWMKQYFGKNDELFQIQELICCFAFKISLNAIIHVIKEKNPSCNITIDPNSIPGFINTSSVIDRALGIIDSVISFSRHERASRSNLASPKMENNASHGTSKRQQHQHLLLNRRTRRAEAAKEQQTILQHSQSVVEENFLDHFMWIDRVRKTYSSGKAPESSIQIIIKSPDTEFPGSKQSADGWRPNKILKINDSSADLEESDVKLENGQEEGCDGPGTAKSSMTINEVTSDGLLSRQKDGDIKDNLPEGVVNTEVVKAMPSNDLKPAAATSPLAKLDQETYDLRLMLIGMPPSELSSAQVVCHVTESMMGLLTKYGKLDGASGIAQCGDIINGARSVIHASASSSNESTSDCSKSPISDNLISSLAKAFITDAVGALRVKAFLRSFVLPFMLQLNPQCNNLYRTVHSPSLNEGKPASRLLTSLLVSLARNRPLECVESVIVTTLVSNEKHPLYEPNRFQCELISRLFRGNDSLSLPAITLLLEKSLKGRMVWTDNTMTLISVSLNRQPPLSDALVSDLADAITKKLSSDVSKSIEKNMKFSTIFHILVSKYGPQVKTTGRIESLREASTRLKTFMSKTICSALNKLEKQ